MSEIVSDIPEFRVKYKDVFHLKNLYVMMHEYLAEEGFFDQDQISSTGDGHRYAETLYMEKFVQKGLHSGGKEMWVWWRTIKMPETKYSGYFRYKLDFDFHVVYMTDLEIMHQGKKMKINTGEIEIFIRPAVEADYQGTWAKHWLLKHFLRLYNQRILSQEFEKREKELWRDAYKFQGKLKQFLNMRTFIPVPEPFWHPIYGYES
jgi:hypothetical protein